MPKSSNDPHAFPGWSLGTSIRIPGFDRHASSGRSLGTRFPVSGPHSFPGSCLGTRIVQGARCLASARHSERERRAAFTLIEVLLACVLASMLSVVMIQVMRTTLVESRRIAESRQPIAETWLLQEQLAIDIGNARGFKITKDSMILGGFLSRDPMLGTRTQQLALVTYRLVPRGEHTVLERSETPFAMQRSVSSVEAVWFDVGGMLAYPKGELIGGQSNSLPELERLGLQSLSGGMNFRLLDRQGKILVEIL